uniref:Glutamine amidotransferase type-2 domain-containing protein n=1 Tax=Medicago truncatula TaxID=3880 RepID=B7FLU8_MEDTR|nr:unknown [Medicago truncatula]
MAATQTLSSSLAKPSLLPPNNNRFFSTSLHKPTLPSLSDTRKPLFLTSSSKNPISDIILSNKNHPQDEVVFINDDKPREECGVVGIYGDSEASRLCYLALHALQHRGQEGAGIVTVNNIVQDCEVA